MVVKTARLLAPVALVAVGLGVYLIVHSNLTHSSLGQVQATSSRNLVESHRRPVHKPKRIPKYYVVKSGDTLSGISSATGIAIYQLIQLNPKLAKSQNSLQVGQRLRLRR